MRWQPAAVEIIGECCQIRCLSWSIHCFRVCREPSGRGGDGASRACFIIARPFLRVKMAIRPQGTCCNRLLNGRFPILRRSASKLSPSSCSGAGRRFVQRKNDTVGNIEPYSQTASRPQRRQIGAEQVKSEPYRAYLSTYPSLPYSPSPCCPSEFHNHIQHCADLKKQVTPKRFLPHRSVGPYGHWLHVCAQLCGGSVNGHAPAYRTHSLVQRRAVVGVQHDRPGTT
jgi:hypothetical protein